MPDLILWCKETDRVKFSEVKSENDHLSEVQIAWLIFFKQHGIEAEACYINRDKSDNFNELVKDATEIFTKNKH